MSGETAWLGAAIFDGTRLHPGHALLVRSGVVVGVVPEPDLPASAARVVLEGGTIAPGYVDLQVNGGGGIMLNDDPSVATLRRMAAAHEGLGATAILPTLITDTREKVKATIAAVKDAVAEGVPGIAGLHLEGPHLDPARKGAHDSALIRPMAEADLRMLCEAAQDLPCLMVTLAPASVTRDQIAALTRAGAIVSLGHTDADFDTCRAAAKAGARCVTHLFNAMRPLGSREPGVVGAALALGGLSAGLIADGIHVHPETMRVALAAKRGPGRVFLVTDAMAPAGTALDGFDLNGRRITRRGGRLTLADGTLAGADLDMTTGVSVLVDRVGVAPDAALAMATSVPAQVIGQDGRLGALRPGRAADFVHLDPAGRLARVWRGGAAQTSQTGTG